MEPVATAFATIVSLIGQYRSERSSANQQDFNEFIEWLAKSQHEELVQILQLNTRASLGIKALLQQDREIFLERLEAIDNALSQFASAIEGFSEVAESVHPNSLLSPQALNILRQFETSGASKVLPIQSSGGPLYLFIDGASGSNQLEFEDERFVDDYFATLVGLGLLRQDYNSKGEPFFVFTRAASQLIRERETNS